MLTADVGAALAAMGMAEPGHSKDVMDRVRTAISNFAAVDMFTE